MAPPKTSGQVLRDMTNFFTRRTDRGAAASRNTDRDRDPNPTRHTDKDKRPNPTSHTEKEKKPNPTSHTDKDKSPPKMKPTPTKMKPFPEDDQDSLVVALDFGTTFSGYVNRQTAFQPSNFHSHSPPPTGQDPLSLHVCISFTNTSIPTSTASPTHSPQTLKRSTPSQTGPAETTGSSPKPPL